MIKIGDTVYEQVGRYFDYDYHPQIVQSINIKEGTLTVHEEAINKTKEVSHFHVRNKTGGFTSKTLEDYE